MINQLNIANFLVINIYVYFLSSFEKERGASL